LRDCELAMTELEKLLAKVEPVPGKVGIVTFYEMEKLIKIIRVLHGQVKAFEKHYNMQRALDEAESIARGEECEK
jgi:hypothetical protein